MGFLMLSQVTDLTKGYATVLKGTLEWFLLGVNHQMSVEFANASNYFVACSIALFVSEAALKQMIFLFQVVLCFNVVEYKLIAFPNSTLISKVTSIKLASINHSYNAVRFNVIFLHKFI